MGDFPASIEQALMDAGFSASELMVLRRLMDGPQSLREMSSKMGRSTGVLDQAVKKLLRKGVIHRELVNDSSKFALASMQSVLDWLEHDAQQKRGMLKRRTEDFHQFVRSLETDKSKPVVEHFHGIDGIATLYRRLLSYGSELLCYTPVHCPIEEDPLRDFYVEYFRTRRSKAINSRVITQNTPLGRRHVSRDPFEYRQTRLVPSEQYAFDCEKIICGDVVASINHKEQKGSIIRAPDIANHERALFEGLWASLDPKRVRTEEQGQEEEEETPPAVTPPFTTRMASSFREFLLTKTSVWTMLALSVIAFSFSAILYKSAQYQALQRVREQAMSIVATASPQFDTKDIDQLHTWKDIHNPVFKKLSEQLQALRKNNPGVRYAYIMRATDDVHEYEFVADADALKDSASATSDMNEDGLRNDVVQPGYKFVDEIGVGSSLYIARTRPAADEHPVTDPWGTWISGAAPIYTFDGVPNAILGVDYDANRVHEISGGYWLPALVFIVSFLLLLFVRFAAYNRSLTNELWRKWNVRKVLTITLLILEVAVILGYGIYRYMLQRTIDDLGNRAMAVVATAASQFDPKDLDQLHWARDMKTDAYQRVFKKLNEIRDANLNSQISYVYILRIIDQEKDLYEFVADADSNYLLPDHISDANLNGLDESEENISPGVKYFGNNSNSLTKGVQEPSFDTEIMIDQWGHWVSACAPINREKSSLLICADIKSDESLPSGQHH